MNELQIFNYEGAEVRTVEINGEAWFVGKDVATVLGYSNTRDALIEHVDAEDRQILQRSGNATLDFELPNRGLTVINESGLYSLILSSQLPNAKQFKHWVTAEVLPTLRKTGSYNLNQTLSEDLRAVQIVLEPAGIVGNQLSLALDRVYKSYTGRSALEAAGVQLEAPTKKQILTPTQIGEQFGLKAQRVNEILAGAGFQHKVAGKWEPLDDGMTYAVMQDVGKHHGGGTPIRQLKWDSAILDVFSELKEQSEDCLLGF